MGGMEHGFVRAILAGAFEPIANGLLDVVRRGGVRNMGARGRLRARDLPMNG